MTTIKRVATLAVGIALGAVALSTVAAPASAGWWGKDGRWHEDARWNNQRNQGNYYNRYNGYYYRPPPVIYGTPYNYGYYPPPVIYNNQPGFSIRIQ